MKTHLTGILFAVLVATALPAAAQEPADAALSRLEARVAQLERRIAALEAEAGPRSGGRTVEQVARLADGAMRSLVREVRGLKRRLKDSEE